MGGKGGKHVVCNIANLNLRSITCSEMEIGPTEKLCPHTSYASIWILTT